MTGFVVFLLILAALAALVWCLSKCDKPETLGDNDMEQP